MRIQQRGCDEIGVFSLCRYFCFAERQAGILLHDGLLGDDDRVACRTLIEVVVALKRGGDGDGARIGTNRHCARLLIDRGQCLVTRSVGNCQVVRIHQRRRDELGVLSLCRHLRFAERQVGILLHDRLGRDDDRVTCRSCFERVVALELGSDGDGARTGAYRHLARLLIDRGQCLVARSVSDRQVVRID